MGMTMRASSLLTLLLLSCNGDTQIKTVNDDPEVTMLSPQNGEAYEEGSLVKFQAIVDDDDLSSTIRLRWESDRDGILQEAPLDTEGSSVFETSSLSVGIHLITGTAIDPDNATGSDEAYIEITDLEDAPTVAWNHPTSGEYGVEGEGFTFSVLVADAQDDSVFLEIFLTSNVDGEFCAPIPDNVGLAVCDADLSVGEHTLTATVVDRDGNQNEADVYFEVRSASTKDNDLDGWTGDQGDCDDYDPSVNPNANEVANGADDDCDGTTDEATSAFDDDGDCYCELGPCAGSVEASCGALAGGDCDDGDVQIFPTATEVCNGQDEDCDGSIDEGTSCVDDDADGYTELAGDCDDTSGTVRPGAPEVADGVDQDCDGLVDEGTSAWDDDGDCYCESGSCQGSDSTACGSVQPGDCDDANVSVSPGALESCNSIDDDCDTLVDESDAIDATAWYTDADGDGYGAGVATPACVQPAGTVSNGSDCDDASNAVFPGASEYCNGADDDCDGSIDENDAVDASIWYSDVDGDGYGGNATSFSCSQPVGAYATSEDCDDTDAAVFPGADEYCNGADDNCDGDVDEDSAIDALTWYLDADGDNFGDLANTTNACSLPYGYSGRSTDCNDADAGISPLSAEICDGVDQDCDNVIDDRVQITYYADADGDSYGNLASTTQACSLPSGYVSNSTDCNDADATLNPTTLWYADADSDSYGGNASVASCVQPAGYVRTSTDCDDTAATVYPGASEYCNGADDDCDGTTDEASAVDVVAWYRDADGDNYGTSATVSYACTAPYGYVASSTDCNDGNVAISPAGTETCDGVDQDCDGTIDDGVKPTWYRDSDSDTYGNPNVSTQSCTAPSGYVANNTDCNDSSASTNPGTLWYVDGDGDGYGGTTTQASCTQPAGYVSNSSDCNDSNSSDKPGGTETCDSRDNDCDGSVDEQNASGCTTYYYDGDGDSYGSSSVSGRCYCSPTSYYSSTVNTDCYDSNASAKPGQAAYFTSNRGDSSFDYNCDGSQTKLYRFAYSCSFGCGFFGVGHSTDGWSTSSIPACGVSGTLRTGCVAAANSAGCTYDLSQSTRQSCH